MKLVLMKLNSENGKVMKKKHRLIYVYHIYHSTGTEIQTSDLSLGNPLILKFVEDTF